MKKRNILIGACVLVVAAGLWIALRPSEKSGITLETAPTERITIRNSVTATGTVEPVTEVEVGTQVSGIIDKLYADYNDVVKAGQLIAVRSGDGERETAFTPAHDIASMTVYGVLEAVERSGQTTFDLGQTPELARIDRELETLKESARRSQDNVRLTDLL